MCEPNVRDMMVKLELVIKKVKSGQIIDPLDMHGKMKNMYNWRDVAQRTEIVYNLVVKEKSPTDLRSKLLK